MKASHQAMFNRAYERIYQELCDEGIPPHIAKERAADIAWGEYEQYCDEKLDEMKTERI